MSLPQLACGDDVGTARRILTQAFAAAGLDSPALDARLLLAHALCSDHGALIAQTNRALTASECETLTALAGRRLAGEPIARIIGYKEFWDFRLALSPSTLVPRPDTEAVVEAALAAVSRKSAVRIADLGTGSGAILVALLREWPTSFGIGTDRNYGALVIARANAVAAGVGDRCAFAVMDFAAALCGPFDIMVSNPPYIATAEIAALTREVRDHDPHPALDGGPDGLDAYRRIAEQTSDLLQDDGVVVVEIGYGQRGPVQEIFQAQGFALTAVRSDLGGVERALTFGRRA